MTPASFTTLFVSLLAFTTLTKVWLAWRHLTHVGRHRAAVPHAFVEHIAIEAHHKAADYTRAKTRLAIMGAFYEAVILVLLTLGGGIQWFADFWMPRLSAPLTQGVAVIASVLLFTSLLEVPFDLYRTFGIEARFGFNKITPRLYVVDTLRSMFLGALFGLPLLYVVLWLMERMGEVWWLYAWGVWVGFFLLLLFIYPTFIAPLFNKFTPLQDQELKARIEALLERCGFTSGGLFVMDGSRRSSHGNAYFTGFGKARRIVFFDTLLERLTPAEIEAVLAHELGHFRRRHVIKRMVLTFAMSLGLLWLLGQLMQAQWFYLGLGVQTPSTGLALLLFFEVLPMSTFLLHPLMSWLSRSHEFEADAYAAEQTDPRDLTAALVKLYQDNASTLTPDPLYSTFYDSHPPALTRISHLITLQGETA
jgi:STE24 endopeptidase